MVRNVSIQTMKMGQGQTIIALINIQDLIIILMVDKKDRTITRSNINIKIKETLTMNMSTKMI